MIFGSRIGSDPVTVLLWLLIPALFIALTENEYSSQFRMPGLKIYVVLLTTFSE